METIPMNQEPQQPTNSSEHEEDKAAVAAAAPSDEPRVPHLKFSPSKPSKPKRKKGALIVMLLCLVAIVVLASYLFYHVGAYSVCKNSGGTLTSDMVCLNISSLDYCKVQTKNGIGYQLTGDNKWDSLNLS